MVFMIFSEFVYFFVKELIYAYNTSYCFQHMNSIMVSFYKECFEDVTKRQNKYNNKTNFINNYYTNKMECVT